jgi:uncharacterized repeat protein (TIGR02543 family)
MWVLLAIAFLLTRAANAQTPGDWSLVGNMSTVRDTPTAVVLTDGAVLVVGGASSAGSDLYNPVTNSWTTVGAMSTARNYQAGTILANGSVLVAGGQDENGNTLASAEIYNPTTQTWTLTGSMTTTRYLHSASLLPNGEVLVAGGWPSTCCNGSQTPLSSSELWNPTTGTWTAIGNMANPHADQTASVLSNGNVLIAGGQNYAQGSLQEVEESAATELYEYATGTWTSVGNMTVAVDYAGAALLSNGTVLEAGGAAGGCCAGLFSADIFNPATLTWSAIASMIAARTGPAVSTILNGTDVLVSGGYNCCSSPISTLSSTEYYETAVQAWHFTGSLNQARAYFTSVTLQDGTVLAVGGGYTSAERYYPNPNDQSVTIQFVADSPITPVQFSIAGTNCSPGTYTFYGNGAGNIAVNWIPGSSCEVTAVAPSGLSFTNWSDGSTANPRTFIAPNVVTTYTANFSQGGASYKLTTAANPANGGTVSPASGTYASGTVVNLSATANSGYVFTSWTGNVANANSASTTVTMNAAESVTANFSAASTVRLTVGTNSAGLSFSVDGTTYASTQTLTWTSGSSHTIATTSPQTPTTGIQNTFASWSDGGAISHSVTASASTTSYMATFTTSYQLMTAANSTISGTVSPASGTYYASGTVVNLSATANSGYTFTNWTGSVANPNSASTTVTMNAAQTVTANFSAVSTVKVTIGTSPAGLLFSVDSATYTSKQTLTWTSGSSHTIATTSPQTSSGTQNTFASWSDGGAISHSVSAPSSATTYTASFNKSYQLTTAASPTSDGTVSPATGAFYASGTVVNLSATPNSGYTFSSWTGNVANASSASTTVTMNAPEAVVANFASASAPASGLTFTPPSVSFGTVSLSGGTSQLLTVTNPGTTAIKFTDIWLSSLQGATSQDLTYDGGCHSSLAAGKSCQITLSLWPSQVGSVSAILNLQDNAPGSPQQIAVSATVVAP